MNPLNSSDTFAYRIRPRSARASSAWTVLLLACSMPAICQGQTGREGAQPAPTEPQLFLTDVFDEEAPPLVGIAPVIESEGPATESIPETTAEGAVAPPPLDPAVQQAIDDAVAAALAEQKPEEPEEEEEPPFAVSGGKWDVKLGGHVQLDYINWADASDSIPNTRNYFEFRRLRLTADGTGYEVYDFRLQMTLEPETVGETVPLGTIMSPDVKDAYFSINEVPWLERVRIGNFFVPFGLEQVTNDTMNMFLERSIPTQGVFTPDREVGIAMYNCTEDKRITWASGVFFDSISEGLKERIDDNQGYRVSGRLTGLPYYEEEGRYLVHLGVGALFTDDQDNRVRFRSRPQIHEGPRIIDSGVLFADSYATGNLEGAIVYGPLAIQSEVYLCNINMTVGGDETIHGGYAHMSYFLTGENRKFEMFGQHGAQFGRNVPNRNVFLTDTEEGFGAWELKARYSHLNLNNLAAGEYNDMTIGFNWYWSDRVRVMFDYIHPVTTADAVFGATKSDIIGMRYDFNW